MKAEQKQKQARRDRLESIMNKNMDNSIPLQREAALEGYRDEFLYLYHRNPRPSPFNADDNGIIKRVQQGMEKNTKIWRQKWRKAMAMVIKLNAGLKARLDAAWLEARDERFEFYSHFSLPYHLSAESDRSTQSFPRPALKKSAPKVTETTPKSRPTCLGRIPKPTEKAVAQKS